MWGYSQAASHPSDTDLEGMTPENVYVIVSINDRLREVPWSYNDDGSLSGTTDDHYFRLTAYTMTAARRVRAARRSSAPTRSGSTPAPSAPSSSLRRRSDVEFRPRAPPACYGRIRWRPQGHRGGRMLYKKMLAVACRSCLRGAGRLREHGPGREGRRQGEHGRGRSRRPRRPRRRPRTSGRRSSRKAREAGAAVKEAGRDVGDAAEKAGDAVAGAAKDAGDGRRRGQADARREGGPAGGHDRRRRRTSTWTPTRTRRRSR